jgi:enoyl-CoA hydratase/carnithine racemase
VNRVVPDDQLLPAALAMAEIIAKWNPEFVGQTKRTFHRAASLDMDAALEMARDVSVMMARLPAG